MRGRNDKTIRLARRLRVNQTDAETVLWNRIRNRQIDGHK
jgi:very-short-patch-repair endonuclease